MSPVVVMDTISKSRCGCAAMRRLRTSSVWMSASLDLREPMRMVRRGVEAGAAVDESGVRADMRAWWARRRR